MKTLGSAVAKIAAPVLGRRGFGEAQVILQWPAVVGELLARDSLPIKLAFPRGDRLDGTLHLRVAAGAALEIQHLEPLIVERINGFFGYRAVARLAIRQGPLPRKAEPRAPKPRPLARSETAALERRLEEVKDPELRAALESLGRAVIAAAPPESAGLQAGKKIDSV
ncbi:MAG: DciA family protein [Aliidongia sp.]